VMADGKWKNMMSQKKIGYTSWNDNFPSDQLPEIHRIENPETAVGNYVFSPNNNFIAIEAPHYYELQDAPNAVWAHIPDAGRTLGGMAVMPYSQSAAGASISYK